ncbi:MAG: ElyC/SanA/YdcF family protein [Clostridium fessum]
MYEYLQYNGIPEDKLLIEDQSSDTVQNIEFSRTVIDRQEYNKAQAARAYLMEFYRERRTAIPSGSGF